MLVSETSKQEATCLRMNWETWDSEQLLSWAGPGGLAVSPGLSRTLWPPRPGDPFPCNQKEMGRQSQKDPERQDGQRQ